MLKELKEKVNKIKLESQAVSESIESKIISSVETASKALFSMCSVIIAFSIVINFKLFVIKFVAEITFAALLISKKGRTAMVGLAGSIGIIGIALVLWSTMTFLAGFAQGFWSLLMLVSFAITVPQTLYGPAANALIASRHIETRTVAMSLHQSAFYIGWFASGSVAALALSLFGSWRSAYILFGVLGFVMGVLFLRT